MTSSSDLDKPFTAQDEEDPGRVCNYGSLSSEDGKGALKKVRTRSVDEQLDEKGIVRAHTVRPMETSHSNDDGMSQKAWKKRRFYLSRSLEALREDCKARNLDYDDTYNREVLIMLLEEDDLLNEKWVHTPAFEYFFLAVVAVNALVIGLEIDQPELLSKKVWMLLNFIFFALFLTEVILKVTSLGVRSFMRDPWNCFDVIVVVAAAIDLSLHVFGDGAKAGGSEAQIVRICRLFRLARVFKELGVLVQSFITSLQALSWILVGLVLWFYLSACFATLFIGRRHFLHVGGEEAEAIHEVREKFSSIPMSMFALFEIMTLEGWVDYVRPFLRHETGHLVFFFLLFIFVSAFFMLNLVTAVVVERTVVAQEEVRENKEREQMLLRNVHVGLICEQLEVEASRKLGNAEAISREVFSAAVDHRTNITEAMSALRWNRRYMMSIFDSLDIDRDGVVPLRHIQQFLRVCDEPLHTSNYARFQASLAQRMDNQEHLIFTALRAIEATSGTPLGLDGNLSARMRASLAHDSPVRMTDTSFAMD